MGVGKDNKIKWAGGLEGKCAFSNRGGTIKFKKLPIDENTSAVTVAAWIKWNGVSNTMPFGFKYYDIYTYGGNLGFNTASSDITGIEFKEYINKWVYLQVVFRKNELGEIYLNGDQLSLELKSSNFDTNNAVLDSTLNIFGWGASAGYRNFGYIERLKLFSRDLTQAEAKLLFDAEKAYINSINPNIL